MIGCESIAQLEILTKHLIPEVIQQHRILVRILVVGRWKILSKYSYGIMHYLHLLVDWNLVLSELLSDLFDYLVFHCDLICAIWDFCAEALAEKITI